MFVYIMFLDDNKATVVQHSEIENFNHDDLNDFDSTKTYSAYWAGDDKTCGGYYDATILHMTGK